MFLRPSNLHNGKDFVKRVSTVPIILVFSVVPVDGIFLGLRDKIADAENTTGSRSDRYVRSFGQRRGKSDVVASI